jgi:hypothetical protein
MTTSISPLNVWRSFNYVRPINLQPDGTRCHPPRFWAGFENTAKVETFRAIRHDRSAVVECHNLASANAYASGRLPSKVDAQPISKVSCVAYVSPTGQYYVQHGNQRMDVHNAATARFYAKNGVGIDTMIAASLISLRA